MDGNKHYIRLDGESQVIYGFSDAFDEPLDTDVCINEDGGRHFVLFGETNPSLRADRWLYKYVDGAIVPNSESLETIKQGIVDAVISHRYEKQLYYEYDGHIQRFESYDIVRMTDSQTALEKGVMTEVEWKYDTNTYVVVTDPEYFFNMKMAGYSWEQKLRGIEKTIIDVINSATTQEELQKDFVAEFDNALEDPGEFTSPAQ